MIFLVKTYNYKRIFIHIESPFKFSREKWHALDQFTLFSYNSIFANIISKFLTLKEYVDKLANYNHNIHE